MTVSDVLEAKFGRPCRRLIDQAQALVRSLSLIAVADVFAWQSVARVVAEVVWVECWLLGVGSLM